MEENSRAGTAEPPQHAEQHASQQPRFQRRRSERIRRRKVRDGTGNAARRGADGRNPLAALVGVGDELRSRARRMLQARGGEIQHWVRRGEGLGRRQKPLAFGNFLARQEERDGEEEPPSAEMLAVSPACLS